MAATRSRMVWIAGALTAFVLVLTFAGTRASVVPAASQDGERVRVTVRALPRFDCGFDAHGAEEAIARHQTHALRSRDRFAAQSANHIAANQDRGDLAIIEDDGSIIVPPSAFDLAKSAVLFTPEADGYRTTPANVRFTNDIGTQVSSFFGIDGQLSTNVSGYRDIPLGGAPFTFYGVTYNTIYVGTNGYITFAQGDTSSRPSVATFTANAPRVAPLWAYLDPSGGGGVYYNRLEGRHVITWDSVPEVPYGGLSTFQAVLYDDGRIAFVYKKVKARTALVGLSPGDFEQEAQPLVFTDPPAAVVHGPLFQVFSKQRQLDLPALMRAFYRTHTDEVDTAFIWADFAYDNGLGVAHSFNVRNDISGIGLKIFDRGAIYGSAARLATIITMGNQNDWPADPQANMAGINSAISIVCHELGHRWLAYVRSSGDDENLLLGRDNSHWSFFLDTRTNNEGSFSALMEGNAWRDGGGSLFTTSESAVNYFSRLEQYLMGLRPPEEVPPFTYLETDAQLHALFRMKSPVSGFSLNAIKRTAHVEQIISREGPRLPDAASAPKTFRVAFILLVESGAQASSATLQKMNTYRDALARYFSVATDRIGSLDTTLPQK